MSEPLLARIAAALERLSPPPPPDADPLGHAAYVWRRGALVAARHFAPVPLEQLTGIEAQKEAVVANLRRLAAGAAAHDVLLWGARGAGKSALVKSAVGALQGEGAGLGLVEVGGDHIEDLPDLFARLDGQRRSYALFVDDLGFEAGGAGPRLLRSLLEGGAEARPGNVRLHVTANRRHIVPREMAEQSDPLSPRDAIDDKLALADRFGLSLGFHVCDQDTYLEIVAGYAHAHGLSFEPGDAIAWATARGGRSGRVAWQYAVELAGRASRSI